MVFYNYVCPAWFYIKINTAPFYKEVSHACWKTIIKICPSSERQFELGKVLEQELRDLGLEKVTLTDHCYVYGLLPATKGYADKPAVGFISHMDTAPDFSGKDVNPQIIPDYDGYDVLFKESGTYL